MNIKKLFSVAAVVTFLGSTFLPGLALAATPDTELGKAYEWAYSKGITTKDTYEAANMTAPITRAEMAKMLANWAKSNGATPDTTKSCTFTDTASVGGDLAVAIVEACQLGLMGQGITAFRPYDTITRAEFGTALSRALWGETYGGGTPYYAGHLNALKTAGIMTVIANAETMKEVRGYVMLMLMRSESETPSICEETDVKVICAVEEAAEEYKDCPAACRKDNSKEEKDEDNTVVKSGDLAVTAKAAEGRKALIGGVSDLDTITFKTSEEVTISSITLERYGYSTIDDVETVQLEDEDGNIIADAKEPNSKGQVKLTLKKDYKTVDGTFKATVVVKTRELGKDIQADPNAYATDVNPGGAATYAAEKNGSTLGFKVIAADSTAKNLNLDDYSPYTYDLVSYAGSKVQFSTRNSAEKAYNFEAGELYEIAKFRVKAPADAAILVKGFTLTEDNNALEADKFAKDVKVTVNGKEVSGLKWNINKDDELVVSFSEVEVAGKETITIAVSMSFNDEFDNFGKTSTYYIKTLSNFNAIDKKTETRVSQDDNYKVESILKHANNGWTQYTFNGGKVKITGSKLGTVNAAAGASNIKVAEGEITVTEALRGSAQIKLLNGTESKIDEIRLVIDNVPYDGSKNGATYTFKGIEIEKSGKVEIRVDLKSDDANGNPISGTIDFDGSFNSASFFNGDPTDLDNALLKYDESGEKVTADQIAGSLSISSIKVQAARASLDNKNTKEVELIKAENNRTTIFEGTYTAKKGAVTLKNFVITLNGGEAIAQTSGTPTFYVTVGKDEIDAQWKNNQAKGDIDDIEVADGASVDVLVEIEATPSNDPLKYAVYNIAFDGEDEDNNPAGQADEDSVKVKVVEQGTLETTDTSAKKTVLLKSNREVAKFRIKPSKSSDDIILKSLEFGWANDDTAGGAAFATNPGIYDELKIDVDGDVYSTTNTQLPIVASTLGKGKAMIQPDVKVPAEGILITVTLKSELADNDATHQRYFTLSAVNKNANVATTFSKYWVPALIKGLKQEKSGDTTRYTFDIDNDGSDTVSNMKFLVDKVANNVTTECAPTTADLSSCTVAASKDTVSSTDNKMSAINGEKAVSVKAIYYEVGAQKVLILKSQFEDFFDLGSDDLMVYSNK